MIGFAVAAAGWVVFVVGLVLLLGVWPLAPAGLVMIVVGLVVDLDRVKEPTRAKRSPSAS
jgi:hypothetical protein